MIILKNPESNVLILVHSVPETVLYVPVLELYLYSSDYYYSMLPGYSRGVLVVSVPIVVLDGLLVELIVLHNNNNQYK